MQGVPLFAECVFLHKHSRTLIVTDLIQHYPAPTTLAHRWFFAPMGWQGICPPPPLSFDFVVHDRDALMQSLNPISEWAFDRIAVTHGECIEDNAEQLFAGIPERVRTERGSAFRGFVIRRLLNQLIDNGLPPPQSGAK